MKGKACFRCHHTLIPHLRSGSEINDPIQRQPGAKLFIHPVVPVLVNRPFGLVHAVRLIQISSKDVPVDIKLMGTKILLDTGIPWFASSTVTKEAE